MNGIFLLDKALSLENYLLCICYHLSLGNKQFIYQAVNMFISNVKFGCLTWESMGVDSRLEPASSGH